MKNIGAILAMMLLPMACAQTDEERAAALLLTIDSLYEQGKFCETLDSIESLRRTFPMAIEARRHALTVWQNASLKMAQTDIARTDSALQATVAAIKTESSLRLKNLMGLKRDSLEARYEAMCGVVRMIRLKQRQNR